MDLTGGVDMFETIEIKTTEKYQMVEILGYVKQFVEKHHIKKGIVIVHVPHTTAALTMNKNFDPVVQEDIMKKLSELIPKESHFNHIEGNSDAHIKASMFGNSETLIIEDGRLELGMFQSLFLCEFDGPRKRKINIKAFEG